MTNKPEDLRKSLAMLLLYPPFLHGPIGEDEAFREALQLEFGQRILIDQGAVSFDRDKFHDATAALYAAGKAVAVTDTARKKWTLSLETLEDGAALHLVRGKAQYRLKGAPMLMPVAADREAAFARLLHKAGFPPDHFATWRALIQQRILSSYEIEAFEAELERSPVVAGRRIRKEVASATGHISSIVPPFRSYYAAFAGAAPATDVADFRSSALPTIVTNWLSWDETEGAKMALLSASHGSFTAASPLADLAADRLVALAEWAARDGDLLSKVGMVELGLAMLPRAPGLVVPLTQIVEELRDMDPDVSEARVNLLMAAYILIEGELARTRILGDFPPFQRRIAALAQASLFERMAFGQVDAAHFGRWALDVRGRNFLLQSLIDLRTEPRWPPEGAAADRLDADFMGRIRNAAGAYADNIEDPLLRDLLLGSGTGSIAKRIRFPASFLPGPIEGATNPAPDAPQEFAAILDRALGGEELTAQSVIALINMSSLFRVENERIDRAIALIRAASFHFTGEVAVEQRNQLLDGLAKVAANTRRPDLAKDVRIMLRRLRIDDDSALPASKEFLICLIAAAAHAELDAWAQFVGDCAVELALDVDDLDEAGILHNDLTYLCAYEPALRSTAGRALAALEGLLGL
ncbi:hypothetical protein [Sphingopyxis terrae]|uniref:hypothetical protein n=1 Tax=Sphingopyxis terrae TaxID=33052 RepID=UPI001C2CC3A0|nr:hypothetical protein [Sphingopyxis terrae]QXF12286.1 hypothetical protein HBA51_09080 [Sphingopyxis terrae subsp. terrae]